MKSRSNRYLRAMSRLTRSSSVDGRISARAVIGSLRSRPRAEHAAMLTNGFRRIRLTLPDPSAVMTKSRSPSVANHTGVATPEPLRRKLVMLRYLPGIRSTSAGAGAASNGRDLPLRAANRHRAHLPTGRDCRPVTPHRRRAPPPRPGSDDPVPIGHRDPVETLLHCGTGSPRRPGQRFKHRDQGQVALPLVPHTPGPRAPSATSGNL